MSAEPEVISIVQQLSRYLGHHPYASDTSEGIARWWIEADSRASAAAVEAALDWLVGCGVIEARQATDGRVHFRRRRDVDDIQARLEALARDPLTALPARGPDASGRPS